MKYFKSNHFLYNADLESPTQVVTFDDLQM